MEFGLQRAGGPSSVTVVLATAITERSSSSNRGDFTADIE